MAYIVFFISAILGTLYLITIFKDAIKRKIDLKFYQVALYSLHAYAPTIMGRAARHLCRNFRTGTDGCIAMGKTRAGGMVMNVSGKNSGIRRHPHHKLSSQGNCYEQTIYSRIMWSA